MFFFINRRLVRDKIILHAISEAYRNILPSGTFPVVIMFVTIALRRCRRERASGEDRSPLQASVVRS